MERRRGPIDRLSVREQFRHTIAISANPGRPSVVSNRLEIKMSNSKRKIRNSTR